MRWIYHWLRSWWVGARVDREVCYLDRKIDRLKKEKQEADTKLDELQDILTETRVLFQALESRTRASIDFAEKLNDKLEEALDATREKLRTCEDIIIPGLTAANATFQDMWDAESARHVMQKVAAIGEKVEA